MKIRSEVKKDIEAICDSHAKEPSPLMMILSEIQKKYGYIPLEVQEVVSEKTGIPVAEIYGVVTFYSFFSLNPKGKYVIGVLTPSAASAPAPLPRLSPSMAKSIQRSPRIRSKESLTNIATWRLLNNGKDHHARVSW